MKAELISPIMSILYSAVKQSAKCVLSVHVSVNFENILSQNLRNNEQSYQKNFQKNLQ